MTLLGKAPLSVEQATEAYQGACTRAAKLAAKGQRGVAEAARQLQLAGDAERDARRVAAKTAAAAAAVQKSTGATVVAGGAAGMKALSAEDRFAQAAFEAALAGVDVQDVAGSEALRARQQRDHEQRAEVVREVLREHAHRGMVLPRADLLVDDLAKLLRRAEMGQLTMARKR